MLSSTAIAQADGRPAGRKGRRDRAGEAVGPQTRAEAEYAPFPGSGFFRIGQKSPVITAMGRRPVAEGCGHYAESPSPEWTEADRRSYAAWQHKPGFKGGDADGIPGRAGWDRPKVPSDD